MPDDNTRDDAERLARIRYDNGVQPGNLDIKYLLILLDARDAALRDIAQESVGRLTEIAREAYAKFTENGTPVLKTDEHLPTPFWSPSGKMMRSGPMMAIGEALARLDAAPDGGGWQPIATAPRDGTKILVLSEDKQVEVAYWEPEGDSWADENGVPCESGCGTIQVTGSWFSCGGWFQPNEVTAWHEIPAPPAAPSEEGEG